MVVRRLLCALVFVTACAHHQQGGDDTQIDAAFVPDACEGLRCYQVDCGAKNLPPTTISGTVYAPNGTLPLFGVNVYVPETDPGPLVDGATCSRCDAGLQGGAIVQALTDETGHFTLSDVPATMNVPVVVQVGKWRRQLNFPNVASCQDLPSDVADTTLPKSMTDMTPNTTSVDMPRIAISTGGADALECLVRKLGVDDKEITTSAQGGRINLFTDASAAGKGVGSFKTGFTGGTGAFTDSQDLWNPTSPHTGGVDALKKYDLVFLSCEGGQYPATKPQNALQAMSDYADLGGRVFMSHWHNIWISGEQGHQATHGIPSWEATSTWSFAGNPSPDTLTATIDEAGNPKGMQFAKWMDNVGGSVVHDQITPVDQARNTASAVNGDTERWVYLDPATSPNVAGAMNFQFTTPQSQPDPGSRCGKVVFSDMHVSADSSSSAGNPYPGGCSTQPLTPQEKALAFMFFDIASCVGSIF